MKKESWIVSDIHIERATFDEKTLFLNKINKEIEIKNKNGITGHLLCPGDVGENIEALEFLSKIKTKVFYVFGNHEFWSADYSQRIQEFKDNAPENVILLHNDIYVDTDCIMVGATMWTDVGWSYNKDIDPYVQNIMGDNNRIVDSEWYYYNNKNNQRKNWNVKIEREKNKEAMDFINVFFDIYDLLVNEVGNSNYDFTGWMFYLIKENKISEKTKDRIWNYKKSDNLYSTLKKHNNLKQKKIIMLSHHIPFMEEILIARSLSRKNSETHSYINKGLTYKEIDKNIFAIRSGTEYPYEKYLSMLTNNRGGMYQKYESIIKVVHYCNNGSELLTENTLKYIDLWVHGHEHGFSFQDALLGMQIATNPVHSFNVREEWDYPILVSLPTNNRKEDIINVVSEKLNKALSPILQESLEIAIELEKAMQNKGCVEYYRDKLEKNLLIINNAYAIRKDSTFTLNKYFTNTVKINKEIEHIYNALNQVKEHQVHTIKVVIDNIKTLYDKCSKI